MFESVFPCLGGLVGCYFEFLLDLTLPAQHIPMIVLLYSLRSRFDINDGNVCPLGSCLFSNLPAAATIAPLFPFGDSSAHDSPDSFHKRRIAPRHFHIRHIMPRLGENVPPVRAV